MLNKSVKLHTQTLSLRLRLLFPTQKRSQLKPLVIFFQSLFKCVALRFQLYLAMFALYLIYIGFYLTTATMNPLIAAVLFLHAVCLQSSANPQADDALLINTLKGLIYYSRDPIFSHFSNWPAPHTRSKAASTLFLIHELRYQRSVSITVIDG